MSIGIIIQGAAAISWGLKICSKLLPNITYERSDFPVVRSTRSIIDRKMYKWSRVILYVAGMGSRAHHGLFK